MLGGYSPEHQEPSSSPEQNNCSMFGKASHAFPRGAPKGPDFAQALTEPRPKIWNICPASIP